MPLTRQQASRNQRGRARAQETRDQLQPAKKSRGLVPGERKFARRNPPLPLDHFLYPGREAHPMAPFRDEHLVVRQISNYLLWKSTLTDTC